MSDLPGYDECKTFASVKVASAIERLPIKNHDQWMKMRATDVTASTAACLLGVHPYVTAYGLWAQKSGLLLEDPEETAPLRRGRLLEPVAVQVLREDHPEWVFEPYPHGFYYRDHAARIGATPDLLVRDQFGLTGIVQIKSVEPSIFRRTWKDENGDLAAPLFIVVQAIIEAYLTGASWAAVAPMVVGFGLEVPVISIPIHTGIIDRIKSEVAAFWRGVDMGKAPDVDYGRDGKLIEQMFDPQVEVIDLSADNHLIELADERATLSEANKTAEERLREIKAELLLKIGNAGAGRLADGRLIVAKRINKKGYEVKPSSYITITVKETKQ